MAMPAPDGPKPPRERLTAKSTADPILKNALRYTISAKEYQTLHKYIISRSKLLKRNALSVSQVEKLVDRPGRDDHNAAAIRASLRVFLATAAGLKAWSIIRERIFGGTQAGKPRTSLWRSPNLRLSLSLSMILLFHRLLFRFFTRLRAHLLTVDAKPFRKRNPRTSKTLTSTFAPAIGASLAGFMLGVCPGDQLRISIAIYVLSRAVEVTYNLAEDEGWIWGRKGSTWERPWWWGSWLLVPLAYGQLLHAFVFDRDCFPASLGGLLLRNSPQYIQHRPIDYPVNLPWPGKYDIIDKLAEMARLNYPPFISPILFPNTQTLPSTLTSISPITSAAHPLINSLSCALLHPSDPSCLRTYVTYWIRAFPRITRSFTILLTLISIPQYQLFYNMPLTSLDRLGRTILRMSVFFAGMIGTSWCSICLFQQLLRRTVLPTQRFFLGGLLGGFWAFLVKDSARGGFLSFARLSIESAWKVGVKRGLWKGFKGGDVWLFVVSLAIINMVYTKDVEAVRAGLFRKVIAGLRGESAALVQREKADGDADD